MGLVFEVLVGDEGAEYVLDAVAMRPQSSISSD